MRIELPNVKDVKEQNLVSVVQDIIIALQEVSDLGGFHGTETAENLKGIREDIKILHAGQEHTNEILNEHSTLLAELKNDMSQANKRLENLEQSQNQMVELLRMIAHNTRRD